MGKMLNKLSYEQKSRLIEVKVGKGILIFTWEEYVRGIERGKAALRQRKWERFDGKPRKPEQD